MIYVRLSRLLYQSAAGPQQCPALSVGCLTGLVSTGRSLTPVDVGVRVLARGEEPTHTNETFLSVSALHRPAKWKMCVHTLVCVCVCGTELYKKMCVVHMCSICVCGEGRGVFLQLLHPLTAI